MTPYLFLFSLSFFIGIFNIKKENKSAIFLLMFLLFFYAAFRDYSVGADTIKYVKYFLNPKMGYGNDSREFEVFFQYWNIILAKIMHNGHFFIFINALVNFSSLYYIIKKESLLKIPCLLLVLSGILWIFYLSGVRQSLAISFFLLSFYFLKKKKWILFISFSILAVKTHTTVLLTYCIIFIILWIIPYIKINKKRACLLIGASTILAISNIFQIDEIFTYFFSKFSSFQYIDRYSTYQDQLYEANSLYLMAKKVLPSAFISLYLISQQKDFDTINNLYIKIAIIYTILYNLFISSLYVDRILLYMFPLYCIGISNLLFYQKENKKAWLIFYLCIALKLWILYMNIANTVFLNKYAFYFL